MTAPFGPSEYDPQAAHEIAWGAPSIARAVGLRFADTFGTFGRARDGGAAETVDGRACIAGGFLAFDVAGLEDVDVDVDLTLVLDRSLTDAVLVGYDANGGPENLRRIPLPPTDARWVETTIRLPRARFAGRGPHGTDLLVAAPGADFNARPGDAARIVIASIEIVPAGPVVATAAKGRLEIVLRDEHESPTAARVGVYDGTGREVLPGPDAVPITRYGERVREVALRTISAEESGPGGPREPWPHANRWSMYVDGRWGSDVAAGTYDVVVMKGPEYRWARRRVHVDIGATHREEIDLARWIDLPAAGWRSGDAHVHVPRGGTDDGAILAVARAEDVHVANLLRMGNLTRTAFEQREFGPGSWAGRDGHHLAAGQEDPRTGRRGHSLHLNVAAPVRDPSRYFLYHETFERLRSDGALTGYAHAGTGWFGELAGLALDVPFGLVDLIEVAQAGLRTDPWYDFLNLGYRLTPVAGSDWPYINAVGTVRSYVHVPEGPVVPGWFDGLRDGRTFVTNGPLLELTVEGAGMGSEILNVPRGGLSVRASARLSPDLGPLERLDLIVQGEVAATGSVDPDGGRRRSSIGWTSPEGSGSRCEPWAPSARSRTRRRSTCRARAARGAPMPPSRSWRGCGKRSGSSCRPSPMPGSKSSNLGTRNPSTRRPGHGSSRTCGNGPRRSSAAMSSCLIASRDPLVERVVPGRWYRGTRTWWP